MEGDIIWTISVFGGAPRKLRAHADSATVSPQGSSIAFISEDGHEIWVIGTDGENPKKILANEKEEYQDLTWSPTGKRLAYTKPGRTGSVEGSIETVSLDGEPTSLVITDPRLMRTYGILWLHDGRLLFFRRETEMPSGIGWNVWAIMTDQGTGQPSGAPAKVTNWGDQWPVNLSVSNDDSRLVLMKFHARWDVYVGELREGGTRLDFPKRLTWTDSHEFPEAWTHDSRSILISSDRTGRDQIFRQELGRETAEPFMPGPDDQREPEFSPDGSWLLYFAQPIHQQDWPPKLQHLMRFPTSGGSPEQVLEFPWRSFHTVDFHCPVRLPRSCLLNRWEQDQLVFYALGPLQGQGKEVGRTSLKQTEDFDWSISPDGSRIAIESGDQLREQIRLIYLTNGREHNLQLPHGWRIRPRSLRWAADGQLLYAVVDGGKKHFIVRIELGGKTTVLFNDARWVAHVRPSPDGRYLAFAELAHESNAWLLEHF